MQHPVVQIASEATAPAWLNLVAVVFVIVGAVNLGFGIRQKKFMKLLIGALLLIGGLVWFLPLGH